MSSTSDAASPPAEMNADAGLAGLRAELDQVDDAIHALLVERAAIVSRVATAKPRGVALRPGREAAILRRLLASHTGELPPVALVRIWRELFAATTSMQGHFAISVCETDRERAMSACAREHFGAATPLHAFHTPSQAIGAVSSGVATAAVLPMPSEEDGAAGHWWTALMPRNDPRIQVVARLPFWSPRGDGAPLVGALVVCASAPDASGNDRSLLGLEVPADASRARLSSALGAIGLPPRQMLQHRLPGSTRVLVEVAGFITERDPRLADLPGLLGAPVVLGAYACPVGGP